MQEILSKICIAARIKDLRQRARLSQAEVAQQLNISRSNYSQIELGNQFPTFEVLYRLASFYGKTYEWLLHGSEVNIEDKHSHLLCDERPDHRLGEESGEIRHIQLVSCVKRSAYIKMANGGQNAVVLELLPDVIYHQPGTLRAFEIEGSSMRNALFHGDIVIARLLSSPSEIEDHRIYVIVTETDMFVERIVASNRMNGLLICVSDVDPLERRTVNFSEIKELWRAEGKYSRELSYAVDSINQYIVHFESSIEKLRMEIEKIKLLIGDREATGGG